MPLVEYVEKNQKGNQGIPKTPTYKFTYLFIFFLLPILGFTNPTPHKNNLVPEICKKRDVEGLVCSLFSYNCFKNPESRSFLVISG
jgi:hypothetical protein